MQILLQLVFVDDNVVKTCYYYQVIEGTMLILLKITLQCVKIMFCSQVCQ